MQLRIVSNPPSPYESTHHEWLEPPPAARMEVYEQQAKSILSENDSPDLFYRWSLNPYQGCQHACAYCYARPYHQYWGWGAGTDFETKIVAKTNAAELLEAAFARRTWKRETIVLSGATDCYQPFEATFGLTRACLEVCLRHRNPVSIITKSFLVVRDRELLAELNRVAGARVHLSIPFANHELCNRIEPQAPPPARRFEAVRMIAEAGVPVGVMVAPIIPGLNDTEVPSILEQSAAAGASSAGYTPVRLAGNVEPVFISRLREAFPERAARVEARIREMRGGPLNDSRFGHRMSGKGRYWDSVRDMFQLHAARLGLNKRKRAGQNSPVDNDDAEMDGPNSRPTAGDAQLQFEFKER